MRRMIVEACLAIGFATSVVAGAQPSPEKAPKAAEKTMAEIQKHVAAVLATKGSYWLSISNKQKDDCFMQLVREERLEPGKVQFEVLISYPFRDDPEATVKKLGIHVPPQWKQESSEKGEDGELEYDVTGTDAKVIAEFVQDVFKKLFKTEPDTFERTADQK